MSLPEIELYRLANIFVLLSLVLFWAGKRMVSVMGGKPIRMKILLRLGQCIFCVSLLAPFAGRYFPLSLINNYAPSLPTTLEVWNQDSSEWNNPTETNQLQKKLKINDTHRRDFHLSEIISQVDFWRTILGLSLFVGLGSVSVGLIRLMKFVRGCTSLKKIKRVHLLSSDLCDVPMATRSLVFRYIIVPNYLLTSRCQLRIAIRHEIQHHRQGDTLWIFFVEFIKIFFCINPAFHLWMRELGELQELSCDESLISGKLVSRLEYGNCLLHVAESIVSTRNRTLFGTAGMSCGRSNPKLLLRRRIEMLTSYSRLNSRWKFGVFVLCIGVGTLSMVSYASRGQSNSETPKVNTRIQEISTAALIKGVATAKGQGGFAIVTDVNTGEILATAHVQKSSGNLEEDTNRGFLKELNNPWSTAKTFLIAKAIENKKVSSNDLIDCGQGSYTWDGVTYHDWKAFGPISVTQIVAQSSNIGTLKIGNLLAPNDLIGVRKFGFGEESIAPSYPGGGSGTFPEQSNMQKLYASLSVGQDEFRVSPIELVQAYAAVVNGGKLLKPVPYGGKEKGVLIRQVIEPETSQTMRKILSEVVKSGTGQNAKTHLYSTGGKTGSSPKISGDEGPATYAPIASFIGFAPVSNPRVAIYVGVEKVPVSHGSTQAAPIFSEIVEPVLKELKVAPDL